LIEPRKLAVLWYFGDLQYWKLPSIAIEALECGYDGPALRRLAGVTNPVQAELDSYHVDDVFREMGVQTPLSKDDARLSLATECVSKALGGEWNVFDAATHIRIHLCELKEAPRELAAIVDLSKRANVEPRPEWAVLERELRRSMADFLARCQLSER
jgi:hypothetical protein